MKSMAAAKNCTKVWCDICKYFILHMHVVVFFFLSRIFCDKEIQNFIKFHLFLFKKTCFFTKDTINITTSYILRNDECFLCGSNFQYHFVVSFVNSAFWCICTIFHVCLLPALWPGLLLSWTSALLDHFMFLNVPRLELGDKTGSPCPTEFNGDKVVFCCQFL